jgi:hypothetical protein
MLHSSVVLQAIGKGSGDGETLGRAGKVHQGSAKD